MSTYDGTHLIFDCERHQPHIQDLQGLTYLIEHFGYLPLRIDESGETVSAPVRMTWSTRLGIALELGPYSVSTEDAAQLRAVLDTYLERARWATGTPEPS